MRQTIKTGTLQWILVFIAGNTFHHTCAISNYVHCPSHKILLLLLLLKSKTDLPIVDVLILPYFFAFFYALLISECCLYVVMYSMSRLSLCLIVTWYYWSFNTIHGHCSYKSRKKKMRFYY